MRKGADGTRNRLGQKGAHIFTNGLCCWSAKEARRFGGVPSRMPGAVDASDIKEAFASETLSSDSHGTQPATVSDFAARLASRRLDLWLRGFVQLKPNHEFNEWAIVRVAGRRGTARHTTCFGTSRSFWLLPSPSTGREKGWSYITHA